MKTYFLPNEQIITEAAGIRHNELYSINCVRIACRSGNITVLGSPQVLMKGFYCNFFTRWIPFRC